MLERDVAFAGVAGQADLLRRGELTARELTELSLARIERLDGGLNAFNAVYREPARAAAAAAEERLAAGDPAPLLGVPVAVKDEMDVAGEVTHRGTGAAVTPAVADAEVVRRLRAAGAVVVGRTTMPELGLWPFTESVTWGVTRNPWDPERTPGGSSGGSAAAVAAGMVAAALGGDGAGSIRIPAACTGLFGLKPQLGRVPRAPHDRDRSHWIVFGALTRSVLDTGIVLDAIADPPPGAGAMSLGVDAAGTPSERVAAAGHTAPAEGRDDLVGPFAAAARTAAPGRLRIGVSEAFPPGVLGRLSPAVAGALRGTAHLLRELGHDVRPADIPFGLRDAATILGLMFRGIHDFVKEAERPQRLERRSRALGRPGALISDRTLERLLVAETRLRERVDGLFAEHDVLLTPVMSDTAVRAGLMEGRGATATYLWSTGWVPFLVLWNSTGQPAASVPAGFDGDGLPLAAQLVGRRDEETTLLALAAQVEAARPWAHHRPPVDTG